MELFDALAATDHWRQASPRPEVTNDSVSSPYSADLLESFGIGPSGTTVTAMTAMRVAAVAACVQKIAGTISTLRLDSFVIDGDSEVKQPRDDLWFKLNEQPSELYTATSHWEGAVTSQLLRGDGFTWIRRSMNGTIRELLPLPWGCVSPWRDMRDFSVRYYICLPQMGINTWVDPSDILHFHGHGFDSMRLRSMSVIQHAARSAIGNALAMDEYSGSFFENGAHPSIILNVPGRMSQDQITAMQTAFNNRYAGLANAHRIPMVLTEGISAKEISLTAEDAQLLEARKFEVVDIARAFGVPPHMIGETTGASAVGAGYEQQARDFVIHTLRLHLKRMEQEINRKLFPRQPNKFVRFDLDDLIEGDSKAQAEYNRAALGGPGSGPGWYSIDEIRKRKGLSPIGGNAAKVFDPRDMIQPSTTETETVRM